MTSNLQVFIKSRVFIPKYADIKTLSDRSKVIRPIRQQYKHTVHTVHTLYIHTLNTLFTQCTHIHYYTHTALYTQCTHSTTYHQVTVLCTKLLTGPLYLHSSTNFPNVLQSNISIYISKYT